MQSPQSILQMIKPTKSQRLYDLVQNAGVDVSMWSRSKDGIVTVPARNTRYNSDWSFGGDNEPTVLNIWYDRLVDVGGKICYFGNERKVIQHLDRMRVNANASDKHRIALQIPRAEDFDRRVRTEAIAAVREGEMALVRVIVATGKMIDDNELGQRSSTTANRCLDKNHWAIKSYDDNNGDFVLVRTDVVSKDVPSNSNHVGLPFPTGASEPEKASRTQVYFVRSPSVRAEVIRRANGKCEYCESEGFPDKNGQPYLETHHVVPLAEGGPDTVLNVAALCANDHRMAHYGADWEKIRSALTSKLNNDKR